MKSNVGKIDKAARLELGAGLAEGSGPGIELVQPGGGQQIRLQEALQAVELAQRVGILPSSGEHQLFAADIYVESAEQRPRFSSIRHGRYSG